jgi:uncharacterized membrane protein YtjA (UPF0391 family)
MVMFSKVSLVLLLVVLAAAVVGFNLLPGIPADLAGVAQAVFFIFLVLWVISLFDVVGRTFRRS